ncbi:hypothetical protein BH10BDE1_BH10BDE1_06590 [soil metagenome]
MKNFTNLIFLAVLLSSSQAFAAAETLIGNADGDLTVNRSAAIVAVAMVPAITNLGDSGLSVKSTVTIDRENSLLTLSLTSDVRARSGLHMEQNIDRRFKCEVFSVTAESTALFVAKSQQTADLDSGTRRDTVIRADCKDQTGQPHKLVVSYDRESYSILINADTLMTANPRFDLVIGPIPKKK